MERDLKLALQEPSARERLARQISDSLAAEILASDSAHLPEHLLEFFAEPPGAALSSAWGILLGKSVIESVTEAILVFRDQRSEPVSTIVMANPGAARLLGRSKQEVEGLEARELYEPEEYERIRRELQPAREEAKDKGHSVYGPVYSRMKRADGALVPVMISYRFVANRYVQPPVFYTIGLARDLSASEQQAEQYVRLLGLLSTVGIAYFRADRDGVTQQSTRTDCELTGYSEEELRKFSRVKLFQRPRDRELLHRYVREHGGQFSGKLVRMQRKDGTLFWAEGDLRILKDDEGNEIGSEGLYRDVTDRIRLQGFINEDTHRVLTDDELFERLKRDAEFHLDYLSSLGHQLQTPLSSLIETLRNFENRLLSAKQLSERLPYVIGQAVVCTRLVRNLSYMDKILRGEPFRRDRVSLARLAIEAKLDFTHLLTERRLDLQIDDDSLDRHLRIYGHAEMLRQVLVNLVDNAIKYSLPGTTIYIRGRLWPEGPALEISNQGFPITDQDREKIFERGHRTRQAKALVPHGTGLGLWLVRKIVEAHGATIRCLEVLEGGQKRVLFRITFPSHAAGSGRLHDAPASRSHH